MKLCELFDDDPSLNVKKHLKSNLVDVLTPIMANKVEFITVEQIMKKLRNMRSGMDVDRGLVMDLLNPTKTKIVKKIEGDKIYLNFPASEYSKSSDHQRKKDRSRIRQKAIKQAKKNIKKRR